MDPASMLAEILANVINHVYDDVSRKQEQRKNQAKKISVATLTRNSINDPRVFEVTNNGEAPICNCIVEWRRAGPGHQNDKFERTRYIRQMEPNDTWSAEQENSRGQPLPAHLPESRVIFMLDGRWWKVTGNHVVRRVWWPPAETFAKKRQQS